MNSLENIILRGYHGFIGKYNTLDAEPYVQACLVEGCSNSSVHCELMKDLKSKEKVEVYVAFLFVFDNYCLTMN